jgi:hypothetical protein
MGPVRLSVVLAVALALVTAMPVARSITERDSVAPVSRAQDPSALPAPASMIAATVWQADNTPLPHAKLRLRSVVDGAIAGTGEADVRGEVRFEAVDEGAYVIELFGGGGRVLAVGQLLRASPGDAITTSIRPGAKAPWFSGSFTNAAAVALAVASRIGVTAVGSNGPPASPH